MTKLIFACDVSDLALGRTLIQKTAEHVDMVKLGLEAMTAQDAAGAALAPQLCRYAGSMKRQVMWDMKLHDIGNTMRAATRNILKLEASLFTIHAAASDGALAAVAKEAAGKAMPLAVTVLTDLGSEQCYWRYRASLDVTIRHFAKNVRRQGIRGFVCSPHEVRAIREAVPDAYIVTPGIRPEWAVAKDEQKRVTTPMQAKQAGADAIVVGRPISQPPRTHTPASAAQEIKRELEAA
jgi:orotidine-5'-phosphate decarboxylase